MHTDNGETQEGQIVGEKISNPENDDKAIKAYQGSDTTFGRQDQVQISIK
jgi:hypothetical protein